MNMKEIVSKRFTNGFVSVLHTEDGYPIETTSTCLPISTEMRGTDKTINEVDINQSGSFNHFWKEKWMIGISTQSGCPMKCKFCATNKVTEKHGWRNLTSAEIVNQVIYAIDKTFSNLRSDGINDLSFNTTLFRILFTRMGEPSLNIDNVVEAIRILKKTYPLARIQISTIGTNLTPLLVSRLIELENEFNMSNWLELQFSVHSTDDKYRQWLQHPAVLSNKELGELATKYYKSRKRDWKVTVNFALSKTTPFDPDQLRKDFDPETCFIKISPINENIVSDSNNLESLIQYKNSI